MAFSRKANFIISAVALILLMLALVGCSSESSSDTLADTSQGTAATVNGKPIGEKAVSTYVADFRAASSLEDEAAWGNWLVANNYTPADVRKDVVNYYADDILMRQAAEEKGIKIEKSAIDEQVNKVKSQFETDDEWNEALESNHLSEEKYRQTIVEPSLLQTALMEAVAPAGSANDAELLSLAQKEAASFSLARRSSHILFDAADVTTAKEVVAKISSGELDFAEAAQRYSIDATSAERGGDVGWDVLANFDSDYESALSTLEKGQMSGLVTSQYGIHLIQCSDQYSPPEEGITSLDDMPAEIVESLRVNLTGDNQSEVFATWFEEYRNNADIKENNMPAGLPYDVDIEAYQKAAEEAKKAQSSNAALPGAVAAETVDRQ